LASELRAANERIITRNQQAGTTSASTPEIDQPLPDEAISASYREFANNVTIFSDDLEGLTPPSALLDDHRSLISASRSVISVARRVAVLFNPSHTPFVDEADLVSTNTAAITAWERACLALEVDATRTPAVQLDCAGALKQDAP
jgi:hypothetical protein